MNLSFDAAAEADAREIALMRTRVAAELTRAFGLGHWSSPISEARVLRGIRTTRVIVARSEGRIVGTLTLATKKPWAIDPSYFTTARRPVYLTDMAVEPGFQRKGIGRRLLDEARAAARGFAADAIRLDAYDAEAGAGPFYAKCGFREVARVVYRNAPLVYFEWLP